MQSDELKQSLVDDVQPIVAAMGFTLVELKVGRSRRRSYLSVIVYRPEGVSVADCAAISRNLLPRLELRPELSELRLEVSSPGLDRELKSPEEFRIFKGRGMRVLLPGESEWIGGICEDATGEMVKLRTKGAVRQIRLADLKKARLDETEEVEA